MPEYNPYAFFGLHPYDKNAISIMPVFHTHILFTPSYFIPDLARMLNNLPSSNAHVDTLVFLRTALGALAKNIIECPLVSKKIISLADAAEIVMISKKDFMEQLVSPTGRAHSCYMSR